MKNLLEMLRGPQREDPTPVLQDQLARAEANNYVLQERTLALELELENIGWIRIGEEGAGAFSREKLDEAIDLARIMYIYNPLINRSASVQKDYVWGQGWNVKAEDKEVNAVIQAFLDDWRNKDELTSQVARENKEIELKTTGNLFFVFFTAADTGRVRVRKIPPKEIRRIVKNPDDRRQPWYYYRKWTESRLDVRGNEETRDREVYYPDFMYRPTTRPAKLGDISIDWSHPVYHRKTGGLEDWDFGLPEDFAGLDWARAAKQHLEDWAAVTRTLARFALALKQRGRTSLTGAKTQLGTSVTSTAPIEANPAPMAGSVWMATDGAELAPFRTAGSRENPEQARMLWFMVCSAVGLPYPFFGDPDIGNLATAKTLDRPTELKMRSRQALWADIFGHIFAYVIEQAVRAPNGKLRRVATIEDVEDGNEVEVLVIPQDDPETRKPRSLHVDVTFPDILERDVKERVGAIVQAATLDGKPQANTLSLRMVSELLLRALGIDDLDEELEALFPVSPTGDPLEPGLLDPTLTSPQLADPLLASGREFVTALGTFVESLKNGNHAEPLP